VAIAQSYYLHYDHPEPYETARVAEALRDGALMLYPTDTVMALGCLPSRKQAIDRLRALKGDLGRAGAKHQTLLCPSLRDIATYAYVEKNDYKLMRALTPGPFTFLLRATKEVPKLVLNPKRKTVGLRVPAHPICQEIMARSDSLLVSASAKLLDGADAESLEELVEALEPLVDLIVLTDQPFGNDPSTVIDLTGPTPELVREGRGMERLAPYLSPRA
jgi:tRNA threonylcarbamoyl adenosine modification protein (Sua5/YciO/YrdC/YwlC family)